MGSAAAAHGSRPSRKHARFFLTKLKYKNELPPVPIEAKLLSYPLDPMRFVRYTRTSLEDQIKVELQTEPDMGMPLDLIDLERYNIPMISAWPARRSTLAGARARARHCGH